MVESIAVVLVSFRAQAHLLRALASVRDAAELIVVDNHSEDGTAEAAARAFPFATVLRQGSNEGFGRAANRGVQHAQSPFVLLLNPDATLEPGGLQALAAAYRRAEHTFGAMGALAVGHDDADGKPQLSVGPYPSLPNEAARKLVQNALDTPGTWRHDVASRVVGRLLRRPRPVAWASASCLLLKREDFLRVGGFDPQFFLYFEDVDLGLRLARAGKPVVFDPSVRVTHHRGQSAAQVPALAQRAYRQGQMRCAQRWQTPLAARAVARLAQWRARAD